MFWKIMLVIYVIITVVTFGLFLLSIFEGAHKLRKRHPEFRNHPRDRVALCGALLRGIILCSLPIYHVILLLGYTINYDDVVNKAINDAIHDLQEEERIV